MHVNVRNVNYLEGLYNMAGKKTALITGASGGIGLEFARIFAKNGYDLVLVARGDALNDQAADYRLNYGVKALPIQKDLSAPNAAQEVYDAVTAASVTVDVLVNNAGFATYGLFTDLDLHKELNMIQLNIAALVHLTGLFLPGMKARRFGQVLNVASTAAFQPGPLMATYYATKAFVLSWSEALGVEMKGTGVTFTALCPGPTTSGFQTRAAMTDSKLVQSGLMSAAEVAQAGYEALLNGQDMVVPGLRNQLFALAARLASRKQAAQLAMNAQSRVGH
jgi:uncharacterized protein